MTFHEKPISPTQMLIDPYSKNFMNWGMKNMNRLFAYGVDNDPLMQKMYILTKRLHGVTVESFLTMDPEDRDYLYKMEMDLIDNENQKGSPDLSDLNN